MSTIKKFIFLSIIITMIFTSMTVFAQEPWVAADENTCSVAVSGNLGADNAYETVMILLVKIEADCSNLNPDDIFYFNDVKTDKNGKYLLKFSSNKINFANGQSNCKIFVKQGKEDVTSSVISAVATIESKCAYDLKIENGAGIKTAVLSVDNPFNISNAKVNVFIASYDDSNKMINVKKRELTISDANEKLELYIPCEEAASHVKAFVWETEALIPLTENPTVSANTPYEHKEILIIGNSYSVDSRRYVSDIAKSLGCSINVSLAQIGGNTAWDLYSKRNQNEFYFSKSPTAGETPTSLTYILENNKYDIIVMQNYWGASDGVLYPEGNDNYSASHTNTYSDFANYLREKQPQAEIMINAVWSNEHGYNMGSAITSAAASSSFKNEENAVQRFTYDLMEQANGYGAIQAATRLNDNNEPLRQFPVGYAVQLAREYAGTNGNKPFFTTWDSSLDFGNLNDGDMCPIRAEDQAAGRIRLNRDGYHLSFAGRYLAGLVWTEILTGKDVTKVTYVPEPEILTCGYQAKDPNSTQTITGKVKVSFDSLSEETARELREIAHKAVRNYYKFGTRAIGSAPMSLE